MSISDLIDKLGQLRSEVGDVEVLVDCEMGWTHIDEIEVRVIKAYQLESDYLKTAMKSGDKFVGIL